MVERVQLKGAHRGYKRGALFHVRGGRIWEQTSHEYDYQYAYAPDAQLEANGSRGRIKVDGHSEWVEVKKIK
ncbi:MAG: hypothetical protein Q8K93_16370 [Reyranella sp.]|nr:hypothetical protein [Reyranella sp.]